MYKISWRGNETSSNIIMTAVRRKKSVQSRYYLRVKPINQYSTSACDRHSSWKRVLDGAIDPRDPVGWDPGAFAGVRTAGLAI